MQLVRTTLRIEKDLKKKVEKLAYDEDTTFQNIFNKALTQFITDKARQKARKIVLGSHSLGVPLDNLRRKDYYPKP